MSLGARDLGEGRLGCFDCGVPYSSAHFPDLVIPNEVWAVISPCEDGGGLLCPNCICFRLSVCGFSNVEGRFRSGPLAQNWDRGEETSP